MRINFEIFSNAGGTPAIYYLSTQAVTNGSIIVTPNKSKYAYGDIVTLQAIPNSGYKFFAWRGSSISTSSFITHTVTGDCNFTARFNAITQISRVVIMDVNLSHANDVETSFRAGYLTGGFAYTGTIEKVITGGVYDFTYPDTRGAEMVVIGSILGYANGYLSQRHYPIPHIFAAGSNSFQDLHDSNGDLYAHIQCGAGDTQNRTGYDIEFWQLNPLSPDFHSSFTTPYIAGILMAAADNGFNKDYHAIRYYAQKGKTFTRTNGFGKLLYSGIVNVTNLNEFNANKAIDADYYKKLDKYMLR